VCGFWVVGVFDGSARCVFVLYCGGFDDVVSSLLVVGGAGGLEGCLRGFCSLLDYGCWRFIGFVWF